REVTVTITDEIPQQTLDINSENGGMYSAGDNEITWSNLTIQANSSLVVTYVDIVEENLPNMTAMNHVAVVTSDVIEEPHRPQVSINTNPVKSFVSAKSADKQSVKAGEELTYTITVTNTGSVDYDGITVADNIPANTTYKEGSASEGG